MKVLVDHSVRQDAIVAWKGFRYAETDFLGRRVPYLEPRTVTKRRREDWRQAEIDALPKIAEMILAGEIQAYSSCELEAEAWRALHYTRETHPVDLFADCPFQTVMPPLDRSKWGLTLEQWLSKDDVISYVQCFFLTPSPERTERFIHGMRENPLALSAFEERCLRRAHVFRAMCKGVHPDHYVDALHLWTAEENGIDVFLTHDAKFKNVIDRQKVKCHCQIMMTRQLLAALLQNSSLRAAQ